MPTVPLFIKTGYAVSGWKIVGGAHDGDNYEFGVTVIDSDMTVEVQWEPQGTNSGNVITLVGTATRTVKRGLTLQIDVLVDGNTPDPGQVTWALSNANLGTLSQMGKLTASKTYMGQGNIYGALANGMQIKVVVTVQ